MVRQQGDADFVQVVLALCFAGHFPRCLDRREQEAQENANQGYCHQQFNEAETDRQRLMGCGPATVQQTGPHTVQQPTLWLERPTHLATTLERK